MKELRYSSYPDDSDDSVQGRAADNPSTRSTGRSSTTSGAFFAESLSQTMGTQMNPGAMLRTSIKSPSARTTSQLPGSPMNRMASSRLSMRGPADSPLPATSPRRLARADGRSGTVVIWGEGWNRSASPTKSTAESAATGPGGAVTPYAKGILSMSGAVDTIMHPLVSESEDLSATPRPGAADKVVGFERPKQDQEFVGHKMLNVCGGFGKLALITQDGGVVQSDGDSGADPTAGQQAMPVPDCGSVRQVVAGQKHTLFLDEDGFLYAGGHNTFGQLGFPGEASVPLPRLVPAFTQRPVAAVSCGQQHSMALTDWGDVYAWGRGSEGQLGCGRFETIPVPRYVHGLKGKFVDAISCGYNASMAVTQQGDLYTWGDDTTGQLGLGPKSGRQASPRLVTLDPSLEGADAPGATFAVGAAGGWGHTCAVTSGGVVWSWGFGGRGQLGLGDFETRATPSIVKGELQGVHIRQVTCGAQFSVALSTDGKVFVWGSGSHYRLGLGDDQDRCLPTLATIKGKDVTQLAVTEDRFMAFAPARITKLIPDCGPLGGGTRINIQGDGFFEAPRIKVSLDMSAAVGELDDQQGDGVTGSSSAVYGRETLAGHSALTQGLEVRLARGALDPYTGMVVCDTPQHDKPTACVVEVSFDNGETYTSSGNIFTIYQEPSIAQVSPPCRLTAGHCLHCLKGLGLDAAGEFTKIRFSAPWQTDLPAAVVPGEWDSEKGGIVCRSPPFPKGKIKVEVALNGQQFSPQSAEILYFEPPQILKMAPDCSAIGLETDMRITCTNAMDGLLVRLLGDGFGRDQVLGTRDLVMESADDMGPDVGSFSVRLPPAAMAGPHTVELSVDGVEWIKTPSSAAVCYVYGVLQPDLKFKNCFAGGGTVNGLVDPDLFPGGCLTVRVGDKAFVAASFDSSDKSANFAVPPYDASTMGADPTAVAVFLHPQGAEGPGIACAVGLRYFGTEGAPLENFAVNPPKSNKGGAATDITITCDNMPEPYAPPEPAGEGGEDGEEAGGEAAEGEASPAPSGPPQAPSSLVRFDPPEGEEGESVVVNASWESGAVSLTSPEELPFSGDVRVSVTFDGVQGKWFDAGVFTVG